MSFPGRLRGRRSRIGILDQVLTFNFTSQTGLIQFVLFVAVVLLVGRVSRKAEPDTAGFQFAPRIQAVSERLQADLVGPAPAAAGRPARPAGRRGPAALLLQGVVAAVHLRRDPGLRPVRHLGHRPHRDGPGSCRSDRWPSPASAPSSAAAFVRGVSVDIGWGRLASAQGHAAGHARSAWACSWPARRWPACVATVVGIGALRVRGLLLAASTLAFAIAAQDYIFPLPILSLGQETVQLPRGQIGPFDVSRQQPGLLLRHAHRAGRRAGAPRPTPAQRHRAHDHRRARERERGGGPHRLAGQGQAHRLRRRADSSPDWAAPSWAAWS